MPPGSYGGIELMCFWLVEGLLARGHEVVLIGADQDGTEADFISTYENAPSERLGEPFPEVVHAARAAVALRELDPQIVHDNSLAGPLLGFNGKVETIVTAHGPIEGDILRYYRLLSEAVHMVAISDAQRKLAPDLSWAGTVHNAIRVEEYPFVEEKEDFVLFLGRFNADKGAHRAIDAAKAAGTPIVLAGKCSEPAEKEYFEREVRPRLGPNVEWFGEADTEQKKDLFSRARCLVFPIEWQEPFGLVMVEAMACGTPVVGTSWGSVPEVVEDGITGFVVEDAADLPAAIERSREIEPAACRRRAEDHFDVENMVTGYENVFRAVIERQGIPA